MSDFSSPAIFGGLRGAQRRPGGFREAPEICFGIHFVDIFDEFAYFLQHASLLAFGVAVALCCRCMLWPFWVVAVGSQGLVMT